MSEPKLKTVSPAPSVVPPPSLVLTDALVEKTSQLLHQALSPTPSPETLFAAIWVLTQALIASGYEDRHILLIIQHAKHYTTSAKGEGNPGD